MWPKCQPSGQWIDNPQAEGLEICGGDLTIVAKLGYEPYYGGSDAVIEIEETCTRCKYPFYDLYPFVHSMADSINIVALLEKNYKII